MFRVTLGKKHIGSNPKKYILIHSVFHKKRTILTWENHLSLCVAFQIILGIVFQR